jgi:hypothetical protein
MFSEKNRNAPYWAIFLICFLMAGGNDLGGTVSKSGTPSGPVAFPVTWPKESG